MPNIYQEEGFDALKYKIIQNNILLVTATDLETAELHAALEPADDFDKLVKFHEGSLTFYFGKFGRYPVIHVQCSMGSMSRDSSIMTVSNALKVVEPKAVIMPGIAFGVDSEKQQIGDVLLAEAIQPYNNKRVGKDADEQRSYSSKSSKFLINRFKNLKSWEYLLPNNNKSSMIPTLLLSGEELIDNKNHRDELISLYPSAKGGEMEGAGVYAACDGNVDCILVKGICDFADGNKGSNKDENQRLAMQASLSLCKELFSSKIAFKEIGLVPQEVVCETIDVKEVNNVLFELYDSSKDNYYIIRNADGDIQRTLAQYGAWIYGHSGCGKSNLIIRNLIHSNLEFVQVNLASSFGEDISSFFTEILFDLAGKIEGVNSLLQPKSFTECTKSIITLLEKHYSNKKLVIFIEEIPLEDSDGHKEFAQRIFALLSAKSLVPSLGSVKIILSSINDPSIYIQSFNQKIHLFLKFVELDYWLRDDIIKLIGKIKDILKIELTRQFEEELLQRSNKSPRFIKKFFRNLLILNNNQDDNLKQALLETERELHQI